MITKSLYESLKTKRSVSGIEKVLKEYNYVVVYPTGGNYKIWTNGHNAIEVKIDTVCDGEVVADYDIFILQSRLKNKVFINAESIV